MTDDKEDRIRARAHQIWEAEGKPHGRDALHWDQATRELDGEDEPDTAEIDAERAVEVVESAKEASSTSAAKRSK